MIVFGPSSHFFCSLQLSEVVKHQCYKKQWYRLDVRWVTAIARKYGK